MPPQSHDPSPNRSRTGSRAQEDQEFLAALIRATDWPGKQYERLFKKLPLPGRIAMLLATAAALYWLVESGAWISLLVLGGAAFVVVVIVHETRMERRYPQAPRGAGRRRDHQDRPRRKPAKDDWWDDMMAERQREEEPRSF
ncbi:hypothetical protein [Kitasatospora sp. KL5]|uniref:hypothetical protein n=1 Tax=Kitasatospora sp. KL5 TaxID=3425125 RepID=UPI003D6DF737